MIIIPNKCKVKWAFRTKEYYQSKGYKFTNWGDIFEVTFDDLKSTDMSFKLQCICDYCGNKVFKFKKDFINNVNDLVSYEDVKICCKNCISLKSKETCLKKYGVANVFQNKDIKEKIKTTFSNNYGSGIINAGQISFIKEKVKKTNLKKYGVENVFQDNNVKEKIKQTCIKKYGVSHHMKNEEIKIKTINKSFKSLYENGKWQVSFQQKYINNIINGQLNYPIENSKFVLDIALLDKKIYIEYDGSGHDLGVRMGKGTYKQLEQRDRYREMHMKNLGWKIIRIISKKDKLPNKNDLKLLLDKYVNYLLNTEHTWIYINIDEKQIYGNNLKDSIDYNLIKINNKNINI